MGEKENEREEFIHAIRKFMEMRTLTKQVLNELIDHIDVNETQGTGKTGAGVNLLQTQKPIHHNSHYNKH